VMVELMTVQLVDQRMVLHLVDQLVGEMVERMGLH